MTDIGDVTQRVDFDLDKTKRGLDSEDDIGTIMRLHNVAEDAAIDLLNLLLDGRYRVKDHQYLIQRVERCEELGIPVHFTKPLKRLNTHRNKFAHKGAEIITPTMVAELRADVGSYAPVILDDEFRFIRKGSTNSDKTMRECSDKEKYVVCVMAAMSFFTLPVAVPTATLPSAAI